MSRITVVILALLALAVGTVPAIAQQDGPGSKTAPKAEDKIAQLLDKVKANPNDIASVNRLMSTVLGRAFGMAQKNPDEAAELCARIKKGLEEAKPTTPNAQALHRRAIQFLKRYAYRFGAEKKSIEELRKAVEANPTAETIGQYAAKAFQTVAGLLHMKDDYKTAGEELAKVRACIESLKNRELDEEAKKELREIVLSIDGLERQVATAQRLAELIGQPAAKIDGKIAEWVNGGPFSDEDLQGKVVLLDFWAVWCGPCRATFPHLIEWHEKYADKGLVIIGLTRKYGFEWNDQIKRAMRAAGPTTMASEKAMMEAFVKHHKLKHTIAIQKDDSDLSRFYGVSAIPHVVLIDRTGKVRLFKVGGGEKTAREIEAEIEKLIGEST